MDYLMGMIPAFVVAGSATVIGLDRELLGKLDVLIREGRGIAKA